MPAPPARVFSQREPWGTKVMLISPATTFSTVSVLLPMWEQVMCLMRLSWTRRPMPWPLMLVLLEMMFRSLTPFCIRPSISVSETPQFTKPGSRTVMPSKHFSMACSRVTTLDLANLSYLLYDHSV